MLLFGKNFLADMLHIAFFFKKGGFFLA